jgi:hypothetical protein
VRQHRREVINHEKFVSLAKLGQQIDVPDVSLDAVETRMRIGVWLHVDADAGVADFEHVPLEHVPEETGASGDQNGGCGAVVGSSGQVGHTSALHRARRRLVNIAGRGALHKSH